MIAYELSRRERIGGLILLVAVFACGLFDHSLWAANDAREGAMIAEMFRTGTWVTPVFNGIPYLEKPPMMHWTGLLFCRLFGTVNEGLVRLPAALFGFGAVMIAYLWARDMGRERAGMIAAFMCATSVQYFEYSKVVLTDTTIAFMVVLSVYLFRKAFDAVRHQRLMYAVFILVSALSFYAKGLLGPGCIWISVCAFLLYRRQWKLLFVLPLIFLPVLILALAPWIAALWRAGGPDMIKVVFWDNQFGRFLSFSNPDLPVDPFFVHKEPFYYYLFYVPPRLMPWLLFVPPALVHWCRKGRGLGDTPAVLLRFALGSILLILHVSTAKATAYALPMYPFLFLMVGVWLDEVAEKGGSKIEKRLIGTTFVLIGVVLLIPPPVFAVAYLLRVGLIWDAGARTASLCFAVALSAAIIGVYALLNLRKKYAQGLRSQLIMPIFMAIAVLFALIISFVYPIYDHQRTHVPFIELVRKEVDNGRRVALASPRERDIGQFMFYLGRRIEVVSMDEGMLEAFCIHDGPAGIIVPVKELERVVRYLSIACDDRTDPVPGIYERPFKTLKSDHKGYKSRDFVLLLNENEPGD